MVEEARLAAVESGLVPASDGWFVVNVRDAAWLTNDAFGARCIFEADTPVVRGTELETRHFPQLGIRLTVAEPGKPTTMYHAETSQEGFLVLAGECLLLIEGEERQLRAWDFVHCPPNTKHVIVGAGRGPCLVIAVGARAHDGQPGSLGFTVDEIAMRHGACVDEDTLDGGLAYATVAPRAPISYRDGWLPESPPGEK
jgi:quercetin dioxygenase-like cupin family protein